MYGLEGIGHPHMNYRVPHISGRTKASEDKCLCTRGFTAILPSNQTAHPREHLVYYPHVSTEPLHAIIVLIPHFTNTFTHALVFHLPQTQPEPVPHKQTPSEHSYPNENQTGNSDYQAEVLHAYHQPVAYPPNTGGFNPALRYSTQPFDRSCT